jgi:hypothetical protein
MGVADAEIHVLDFNQFTDKKLRGSRYRIAENNSFTYCFDSTPEGKSFTNLASGALFVQYQQTTSESWPLPEPKRFDNFSCDRSSQGGSRSKYRLFDSKKETEKGMLVVLVFPAGDTSPVADFNITPRDVHSTTDSRICFLFIENPPDGHFELRWRTERMKFSIAKEVQLAFDDISKISAREAKIPTLHRYKPKEQPVPTSAHPTTRRTVWDVVVGEWTTGRTGWLIALAVAFLLGLFAISHVQTEPGKRVSLFGINFYTKGGASDLNEKR